MGSGAALGLFLLEGRSLERNRQLGHRKPRVLFQVGLLRVLVSDCIELAENQFALVHGAGFTVGSVASYFPGLRVAVELGIFQSLFFLLVGSPAKIGRDVIRKFGSGDFDPVRHFQYFFESFFH